MKKKIIINTFKILFILNFKIIYFFWLSSDYNPFISATNNYSKDLIKVLKTLQITGETQRQEGVPFRHSDADSVRFAEVPEAGDVPGRHQLLRQVHGHIRWVQGGTQDEGRSARHRKRSEMWVFILEVF